MRRLIPLLAIVVLAAAGCGGQFVPTSWGQQQLAKIATG